MTFLQLVNRLRRKCRVTGSNLATLQGVQVEEYNRLIAWTNEAWMDIQEMRQDWLWMRTSLSFQTQLNKQSYTLTDMGISDFGNYANDTFRNYVTATGLASEIQMPFVSYESWRNTYQLGATRFSPTRPVEFTILPDLSIGLGPVPIAGYTITGDYYKVPTEMVNDADIPGLPVQYHAAIVYRAMQFYGASEAAQEVYQEGVDEFKKQINRLALSQLTDVSLAGSLA